jgi:hypothetical protein
MNSELNYLVVKAQMDHRIRAAERARTAGGDPEESSGRLLGAAASLVAQHVPRTRPAAHMKPEPCVGDH